MWDKPATLRQIAWLAAAVTVGVGGVGYQLTSTRTESAKQVAQVASVKAEAIAVSTYATCLERKLNIDTANKNWTKVVVKPGEHLETYKTPVCVKP